MNTSFTLDQYQELKAAIAQGALTVNYSGGGQSRSVTYRSLDEMLRLLRLMESELGIKPAGAGRTYASFTKGYGSGAPLEHEPFGGGI